MGEHMCLNHGVVEVFVAVQAPDFVSGDEVDGVYFASSGVVDKGVLRPVGQHAHPR